MSYFFRLFVDVVTELTTITGLDFLRISELVFGVFAFAVWCTEPKFYTFFTIFYQSFRKYVKYFHIGRVENEMRSFRVHIWV